MHPNKSSPSLGRRTFLGITSAAIAGLAVGIPLPAFAAAVRWCNPLVGSHDRDDQVWHAPRERGRLHEGYDIGTYGKTGQIVYAGGDGHVFAVHGTSTNSRGLYVIIQHPDGYRTLYQHLNSISVSQGASIAAGQPLGVCGNSGGEHIGVVYAIHLHLELHLPESGIPESSWVPRDPKPFFADRDVTLGETPPIPTPEEDWFAMATREELAEVVRTEIAAALPRVRNTLIVDVEGVGTCIVDLGARTYQPIGPSRLGIAKNLGLDHLQGQGSDFLSGFAKLPG